MYSIHRRSSSSSRSIRSAYLHNLQKTRATIVTQIIQNSQATNCLHQPFFSLSPSSPLNKALTFLKRSGLAMAHQRTPRAMAIRIRATLPGHDKGNITPMCSSLGRIQQEADCVGVAYVASLQSILGYDVLFVCCLEYVETILLFDLDAELDVLRIHCAHWRLHKLLRLFNCFLLIHVIPPMYFVQVKHPLI